YAAGLVAVICIGETLTEREAGTTLDVIDGQLAGSVPDGATASNTVIAYEPVWAIGTGKVPTLDQIAEVHAHIRARLAARFADGAEFSLLYGGSVKGSNAADIFGVPHVDGALVGGASLKADDFSPIITALQNA
ncbi:MAG: triose-phosphate isomerase, partial [Paracoccaceae bacterium]|nr:triose-phosphate isomerase [Paracoccaceae bacterium]